jgi:hypothetical protein
MTNVGNLRRHVKLHCMVADTKRSQRQRCPFCGQAPFREVYAMTAHALGHRCYKRIVKLRKNRGDQNFVKQLYPPTKLAWRSVKFLPGFKRPWRVANKFRSKYFEEGGKLVLQHPTVKRKTAIKRPKHCPMDAQKRWDVGCPAAKKRAKYSPVISAVSMIHTAAFGILICVSCNRRPKKRNRRW